MKYVVIYVVENMLKKKKLTLKERKRGNEERKTNTDIRLRNILRF